MLFTAIQATLSAVLTLVASYIGTAVGGGGWYYTGTGLSVFTLLISVWAVPETKYERPMSAYQGETTRFSHFLQAKDSKQKEGATTFEVLERISTTEQRQFDLAKYKPRTIASDMQIFLYKADWTEGWRCVKGMVQVMLFPDIFWAFLINGVTM